MNVLGAGQLTFVGLSFFVRKIRGFESMTSKGSSKCCYVAILGTERENFRYVHRISDSERTSLPSATYLAGGYPVSKD